MHTKNPTILDRLSTIGARLTPARIAIARIFDARNCEPMTAYELIELLGKKGIHVNKTTVYRELEFLKTNELVREISIMGLSARYEPSGHHHHHLICTRCDKWLPIEVNESFIKSVKQSVRKHKALLTDHLLEFFGVCSNCRKTS